ncbi:nb-arc domain-containing protein [Plectosphaerella plurivora]|uniref:Nb-arc domain-containing protein n=1 Tax=Plectosphaerella plurivora TaxID=936078 RepID=A0A9P8V628_9PEZI|nr:nb-arc domain-containing protein [Plectosphaerella plurivora]
MFKGASQMLWKRLGRASWRRQVYLRMIHDGRKDSAEPRKTRQSTAPAPKAARRDVAVDAFNFQSPALKTESDHSGTHLKADLIVTSKPSKSLASQSNAPSVFSAPILSRTTSYTSVATSLVQKSLIITPVDEERPPPSHAVLQRPKQIREQQPYLCQFCGFDINLNDEITSDEEWQEHIYRDLFAYLCTFDSCNHPRKVYGDKDEWYHHELSTHRIPLVWTCGECEDEFSERSKLQDHILTAHSEDFTVSEVSRSVAFLRPIRSQKAAVGRTRCPLCPSPVDMEDMRYHIAGHLEAFCHICLDKESVTESSDSDDIMSQGGSDNMSENGAKIRFIEAFATEQHVRTSTRYLPHAQITEEDDLGDASDEEDSKASAEQGPAGGHMSSRAWRVQSLMEAPDDRDRRGTRGRSSTDTTAKLQLDTRSFPRDENFRGREKELINLYTVLSDPGKVYILSAEGGMGKTAVAVEFSHRYEHVFECIFWVQAETPVGANETFNQIATAVGVAEFGDDQQTLTRKGRQYLETTTKKWLLVLDNVEKWEHIDAFTPSKTSATAGSILITTRHQHFTAPSRPVNYYRRTLEELTVDEGADLLLHGLPRELQPNSRNAREDPEMKVVNDIAKLAGLPLAIIIITGCMKSMYCRPSEFWSYWDSWWLANRPDLKAEEKGSTRGRLEQIMKLSVEDLGDDALSVMRIMAFLSSDGTQKDLLTWDQPPSDCQYLRTFRINKILRDLLAKRFISLKKEEGKEVYVIHRALQSRLLVELHKEPERWRALFRVAFQLVRNKLPRPSLDTTEQHKWNQFKEYLPHVAHLQRAYADPTTIVSAVPFVGLAELFKDGGVLLWQRFLSQDAMRLLTTSERILDQLETEHEDLRAEIHVTMNLLLQYLGIARRKESSERFLKILEYRQKRMQAAEAAGLVTDAEAMGLINAKADYANSLLQFNKFRDAEKLYADCHESLLQVRGDNKEAFSFAKLNHHMAYCKMYHGEFEEANNLSSKAVELIGSWGTPALRMRYQFDQACILLQSGDKPGALDLHERILNERLEVHGKESYFTLQSQYAVAAMYSYLERWDDAEWQLRDALRQNDNPKSKNIWPDAAAARAKYHLSQILVAKGEEKHAGEAETLAKEAKDVLSRLLVYDPIRGVKEEDTGALFDHLQPVFGGRWTGLSLLKYVR